MSNQGTQFKITNIRAAYFSGTGTTERTVCALAKHMSASLNVPVDFFDFTQPSNREMVQTFSESELCIIGVPVYAGRVPNVLLPYLNNKLCGNGSLAVPVVLYGNRNYDDSLIELRDILECRGFRTIAAGAFIGEHSFSRTLAAMRPDERDMEVVKDFAHSVVRKILKMTERPNAPVAVCGETPLRPYYIPKDRDGNAVSILKVKPLTDLSKCTQCGLCTQLCPMGSINREDASKTEGICIKCCACVKKCPTNAKYYANKAYLYHQHELEEMFARRAEPEVFI